MLAGQFMNWEDREHENWPKSYSQWQYWRYILYQWQWDNVRLTIDDSTGNFTGSSSD